VALLPLFGSAVKTASCTEKILIFLGRSDPVRGTHFSRRLPFNLEKQSRSTSRRGQCPGAQGLLFTLQGGQAVVAPSNNVRQALFMATTPDGSELVLALLEDGRCAIVRSGEIVESCKSDPRSLDRIVQDFLRMSEGM
jgi:hypothetical protein